MNQPQELNTVKFPYWIIMVGNIRGVPNFIIFCDWFGSHNGDNMWLDRWWEWPRILWPRGQLFSVLASNSSHCHPADGVFDTNILLSPVIVQVSLQMLLSDKENPEWLCCTIIHAVPCPWTGLLSQTLKPWKIILRTFSDFPRKLYI